MLRSSGHQSRPLCLGSINVQVQYAASERLFPVVTEQFLPFLAHLDDAPISQARQNHGIRTGAECLGEPFFSLPSFGNRTGQEHERARCRSETDLDEKSILLGRIEVERSSAMN